jgi:hypothetical protein
MALGQRPGYLQDAVIPEDTSLEDKEENEKLNREWEEKMSDFTPSDMITFEIGPRGIEELFEVIDFLPSLVRGAFFVSSQESKDLTVVINAPDESELYRADRKKEGIFYFDASQRGMYHFRFNNHKFVEKLQVTVALHTGNCTDEPLDKSHITPVEAGILELVKGVKDFQMEQQFAQLRQESHFKTVYSANRNLFWFSLLECVGVLGVSSWQVYYIKKILDHRRLI